jgi:hypothetical protein
MMYRTSRPYAAVTVVASGRFPEAELAVPGLLGKGSRRRVRVLQQVREHARAAGVRAHARWSRFEDNGQGPVTVFIVRAGPGRRILTPGERSRIRSDCLDGAMTQRQVAAKYEIAQATVWGILHRGSLP